MAEAVDREGNSDLAGFLTFPRAGP